MKKLFTLLTLSFFCLTVARAQVLEATVFEDLINNIEESQFTYKGKGILFGFLSVQSCMYVGQDMVIFKNYCYPERNYPARGFTIISKKFGMIDLYQEKIPHILKREIIITEFPEIVSPYLSTSFPNESFNTLNALIEKLYHQYNPACWSNNYSDYTRTNDVSCNVATQNVIGFEAWAKETQAITADLEIWSALMNRINAKLSR
jgi:hypothetical protein